MAPNWSSLPHELIARISDRLSTVEDFTSFITVCRSFRSATSKEYWQINNVNSQQQQQQPPWLLLSCNDHDGDDQGRIYMLTQQQIPESASGDYYVKCDKDNNPINNRGLLSTYRNNKKFYMKLPELHGRHCWGTRHGWIVTLGLDQQLHLFNPLNRRRTPLPQITCCEKAVFRSEKEKAQWMRYTFIRKASLVKKPNNKLPPSNSNGLFNDFFIGLTTAEDGRLRVMRPGTNAWEYVNEIRLGSEVPTGPVFDVVNYNDQIYALCDRGRMLICSNLDAPGRPTAAEALPSDERLDGDEKLYLVESDGDLLMVVRHINYDIPNVFQYLSCEQLGVVKWYDTAGFGVFKLNEDAKEWEKIEDLGDRALFVGDCESVSVSTPEAYNCSSNCIYFTDDNYEHFMFTRGHDMGVFHLKDKSIRQFYEGVDTLSSYSAPNWFIPTFV